MSGITDPLHSFPSRQLPHPPWFCVVMQSQHPAWAGVPQSAVPALVGLASPRPAGSAARPSQKRLSRPAPPRSGASTNGKAIKRCYDVGAVAL
ncbi:hypothetical protein [Serratia sp. UGAL515B_01]|uniref:hypothetical protein n=1 Tax=Serratia sp. UGAL515B_01 TaxID=2986763 RepID=UPI002955BBCC|nr:hypothetical protein [Serratia sp. UGAL515B_01]WON77121.1 hypothetical protein OK023_18545 [Serratia sp. UGAL515B_01]